MKLSRIKTVSLWGACVAFSMILGFVCWAVYEYGGNEPTREPAMEVSEYKVAKAPAQRMKTHVVAEGETLSQIAEMYNLDVDTLVEANEIDADVILPGERLLILPKRGTLYTVAEGDSLWRIAKLYGVDVKDILNENDKGGAIIRPGEKLFIPGGKSGEEQAASVPVSRMGDARFLRPATGVVSSPFGRRWGKMHEGVDIADEEGTPIQAALGGRVTYAGWVDGYGKTVVLEHRQGYTSLYGHMRQIEVVSGDMVSRGQVIGKMGSTGNSTGPHVHFEVRKDGELLNPGNVLH